MTCIVIRLGKQEHNVEVSVNHWVDDIGDMSDVSSSSVRI